MAQLMKASPTQHFNNASDVTEHELKILVDNDIAPEDILHGALSFSKHLHTSESKELITSQRDNNDLLLNSNGFNLRVRGNARTEEAKEHTRIDSNIDVCIKTNPQVDPETCATKRFEYEANYNSKFSVDSVDTSYLKTKYRHLNGSGDKLREALGLIDSTDQSMKEIFRLSVNRTRYLLEFKYSNDIRVVGELNIDRVKTLNRGATRYIADEYTEVEFEIMHKVCQWNNTLDCHVTHNATEEDICTTFVSIKNYLLSIPSSVLTSTTKSSRGYKAYKLSL